ncbi:hypothetical protein ACFYKX_17865 [Cytobacillus sp. FJAT-54145]|uniref:Uncharacterized protein n=1 Tax=Cytobacillus spartinae TaxID=3299023 RepID=A0ABW6KID9_9BACI
MEAKTYLSMEEEVVKHPFSRCQLVTTPGIWINGRTYWVHNGHEKIVTEESITIQMKEHFVHSKIKLHELSVKNHNNQPIKIKLLCMNQHQYPVQDHFTFVSPTENVLFHLTNKTVFLVNGCCQGKEMEQMTVQPFWNAHTDQIWRNEKIGNLHYQPMAKGTVASIFSLNMEIPAKKTAKGHSWIIYGKNKEELSRLNKALLKKQTSNSF